MRGHSTWRTRLPPRPAWRAWPPVDRRRYSPGRRRTAGSPSGICHRGCRPCSGAWPSWRPVRAPRCCPETGLAASCAHTPCNCPRTNPASCIPCRPGVGIRPGSRPRRLSAMPRAWPNRSCRDCRRWRYRRIACRHRRGWRPGRPSRQSRRRRRGSGGESEQASSSGSGWM
ncbi:hypothetical protein D3C73_1064090 [compost metagenome]